MENNAYEKTGYLQNDFRIFHLCDTKQMEFSYHYHDFDKIVLFLSGDVTYSIEGRKYELKPYDIILVNAGEIHRPVIHSCLPYERIIIYISSGFMQDYKDKSNDLTRCFREAKATHGSEAFQGSEDFHGKKVFHGNVLRIENMEKSRLFSVCRELERSFSGNEYANELYQKVLFLEFMIWLNRALINNHVNYLENEVSNEKIAAIVDYINSHLREEVTVDDLAERFFISRSYLMHLFKAETGYSIGSYISEKRLLSAKTQIQNGMSVTEACYACGFRDYSTFSRAFKKKFGTTPKHSGNII